MLISSLESKNVLSFFGKLSAHFMKNHTEYNQINIQTIGGKNSSSCFVRPKLCNTTNKTQISNEIY